MVKIGRGHLLPFDFWKWLGWWTKCELSRVEPDRERRLCFDPETHWELVIEQTWLRPRVPLWIEKPSFCKRTIFKSGHQGGEIFILVAWHWSYSKRMRKCIRLFSCYMDPKVINCYIKASKNYKYIFPKESVLWCRLKSCFTPTGQYNISKLTKVGAKACSLLNS